MKSINQIFKDNPYLMEEDEVKELIEYCKELEDQIIENTQTKQFSFEDKLTELVRDIHTSIQQILKQEEEFERFGEEFDKPDYEESIINLKKYIISFSEENKFRL